MESQAIFLNQFDINVWGTIFDNIGPSQAIAQTCRQLEIMQKQFADIWVKRLKEKVPPQLLSHEEFPKISTDLLSGDGMDTLKQIKNFVHSILFPPPPGSLCYSNCVPLCTLGGPDAERWWASDEIRKLKETPLTKIVFNPSLMTKVLFLYSYVKVCRRLTFEETQHFKESYLTYGAITEEQIKELSSIIDEEKFLALVQFQEESSDIIWRTRREKVEHFSKSTMLNLVGGTYSYLGFIPKSLRKLENLSKLNFSWAGICTLPELVGYFPKLTQLNLAKNGFRTLPEWFGSLKNLTILTLAENQIQTLPKSFVELVNMTELDLSHNQIQRLPKSFGKLSHLTRLLLGENLLQTVPPAIRDLSNLIELDLSSNLLIELPIWFECLAALSVLNLSHNELHELPNSFGYIPSLTTLNLAYNQLKTLRISFGYLTALTQLDLSHNEIQALPTCFGKLERLTTLTLEKSRLAILPRSFGELLHLSTLSLSRNRLTRLPELFGNLPFLTNLYLAGNPLEELSDSFVNLVALSKLDLSGTLLKRVPERFGNLAALSELTLENTQLQFLPESLINLPALTRLSLQGTVLGTNPVQRDWTDAPISDARSVALLAQLRQRGCRILCDEGFHRMDERIQRILNPSLWERAIKGIGTLSGYCTVL